MTDNIKMKITIKDILWNGLGNFLTLAMNILLLPMLLRVLPSKDLGLWYVFSSISSLITILDFGFSPTISRNVTFAWCGAKELQKEGLEVITSNSETNYSLLKSLLHISHKIYMWISIISSIILLTIGTLYIYSLIKSYNNNFYYISAWIIYSFSIVINMYYSYWNAFLRGIGALKKLNIATIISRVIFVLISLLSLFLNCGLIGIAFAQIISGIILRQLCKKEFIRIVGKQFFTDLINGDKNQKAILKQLMPNTTKYGLVSIGGFFSQRADTLLCSSFLGLEVTSSYGLTMQLFGIIGSVSQLMFNSYVPQITVERLSRNHKKMIYLLSISIAFQFIIGLLGIITLAYICPYILDIMGSTSNILPSSMIVIIGFIMIFDWNTSIFLNFLMTANKIPFVKASLFSGIFFVAISYILLIYTDLNIYALIIGRAIIGFGFNNWYWIFYVCKELDTKFHKLVFIGFSEIYIKGVKIIKRK